MRRRAHDLDERCRALPRRIHRHDHALAWECEGNCECVAAMTTDAVAGVVQEVDLEGDSM
jgi:hypothetical protein